MELFSKLWGAALANKDSIDLAASMTVITGIAYAWFIWLRRPRLNIYFDEDKTFDEVPDAPRNVLVKWTHVVVKNSGFSRAEECNGYILKIFVKTGSNFSLMPGFKSDVYIHQHWANEPRGYDSQVVEGRRERRLDFCYLDLNAEYINLFTESQLCGVPTRLVKGEYKILFAASAKNAATTKKWMYIKWDGSWSGFEIKTLNNLEPMTFIKKFIPINRLIEILCIFSTAIATCFIAFSTFKSCEIQKELSEMQKRSIDISSKLTNAENQNTNKILRTQTK